MYEKAVIFPWQAFDRGGSMVREIFQDLQHERGFNPCFRREAPEKDLQLIAVPTIAAQAHSKERAVREVSPLWSLPKEERMTVYREVEIHSPHMVFFYFLSDLREIEVLTSYIAGTFATTTHLKPAAITFKDLVRIIFESTLETAPLLKELTYAGMLIIQFPLNNYSGWEKASGGIFTLLAERVAKGLVTVFVDVASGDCQTAMRQGLLPTADEFNRMFSYTSLKESRLSYFVEGPNTKILWPAGLQQAPASEIGVPELPVKSGGGMPHVGRKTTFV